MASERRVWDTSNPQIWDGDWNIYASDVLRGKVYAIASDDPDHDEMLVFDSIAHMQAWGTSAVVEYVFDSSLTSTQLDGHESDLDTDASPTGSVYYRRQKVEHEDDTKANTTAKLVAAPSGWTSADYRVYSVGQAGGETVEYPAGVLRRAYKSLGGGEVQVYEQWMFDMEEWGNFESTTNTLRMKKSSPTQISDFIDYTLGTGTWRYIRHFWGQFDRANP